MKIGIAMNLKIYDRNNTSNTTRKGERSVSLNAKNGIVFLSSELCKELELKKGDKVVFAQGKDKEWFFAKDNNNEAAFDLYIKGKNSQFMSKGLVNKILSNFKLLNKAKFLVSKETKDLNELAFYQLIPYKK